MMKKPKYNLRVYNRRSMNAIFLMFIRYKINILSKYFIKNMCNKYPYMGTKVHEVGKHKLEINMKVKVKVKVTQSCPTLYDPMDCSLKASSVHGISHTRILEWVTFPFSRGSYQPRDQTQVSHIPGRFFTS